MGKLQRRPPPREGLRPEVFVLIERRARPPMPWTWAIHWQGRSEPSWRAVRGYRSADDAWEAGQAALARLGLRPDAAPPEDG